MKVERNYVSCVRITANSCGQKEYKFPVALEDNRIVLSLLNLSFESPFKLCSRIDFVLPLGG